VCVGRMGGSRLSWVDGWVNVLCEASSCRPDGRTGSCRDSRSPSMGYLGHQDLLSRQAVHIASFAPTPYMLATM
jgi:hypothetical protein